VGLLTFWLNNLRKIAEEMFNKKTVSAAGLEPATHALKGVAAQKINDLV
jgi:hypothetical protein